ncbi:MAG: hypothetical protein SV201_12960 [Pseudomonadota bacterium]|nr:hypothetical protein [Pseudomonadota bacterium]
MQAELSRGADPDTGLRHWQWQEAGIHFKLTQRLPDQTRAFFDARGFDKKARERIALACVFQSEFKNTADNDRPPVEYDLSQWRIHTEEGTRPLMVRETWEPIWQQHGLPKPAQIAFEWALLPTYQKYAAGDYNWGMTVYGLAPGSEFDLEFSWSRGDKHYTRRIDGIKCPPDIHPQPE